MGCTLTSVRLRRPGCQLASNLHRDLFSCPAQSGVVQVRIAVGNARAPAAEQPRVFDNSSLGAELDPELVERVPVDRLDAAILGKHPFVRWRHCEADQ